MSSGNVNIELQKVPLNTLSRAFIKSMLWEGRDLVEEAREDRDKQRADRKRHAAEEKAVRDRGDVRMRQRHEIAMRRAFCERWFGVVPPPLNIRYTMDDDDAAGPSSSSSSTPSKRPRA